MDAEIKGLIIIYSALVIGFVLVVCAGIGPWFAVLGGMFIGGSVAGLAWSFETYRYEELKQGIEEAKVYFGR